MFLIAICDDDASYVSELENRIRQNRLFHEDMRILSFFTGREMYESRAMGFQLIFMDMQLSDADGYELVMKLRREKKDFVLGFCSGIKRTEPLHLEAGPYRYIMKDADEEVIDQYVTDLLKEMIRRGDERLIRAEYRERQMMVPVNSIVLIEKAKRGSYIYMTEAEAPALCAAGLHELYGRLHVCGFAYAHSSYIVNMRHILMLKGGLLTMTGGRILSISRKFRERFKNSFNEYNNKGY